MDSQHNNSDIRKPTPRYITPTPWIPDSPHGQLTTSPAQDAPPATHKDLRKALRFLSSSTSGRPASPESSSGSTAQIKWDTLRQHVLMATGKSSPGTPTQPSPPVRTTSSQHYSQPSSVSSTSSFTRPPSRSQTPKPSSRLAARLGFKQVVDHAREAAVDENRKFADDVFRACWAARSGDALLSSGGGGRTKHGDNNSLNTMFTGASSMYLPFAKSTAGGSLSSVNVSASGGLHSKKSEHQYSGGVGGGRPQSPYGSNQPSMSTFNMSATLASASTSAYNLINSPSHFPPHATTMSRRSIKYLHHVLWQASGSSSASLRSVYLPHEALVLSALLVPFMSVGSNTAGDVAEGPLEEERWLAVDAFDLLVKTWPPANELTSAERCLWCTKASTALPASPLRSRILSALWGLTNPNENHHAFLSPDTIHPIACGVFLLFPIISTPPPPPSQYYSNPNPPLPHPRHETDSSDIKILEEVLSHLSSGVLDEEACEDEYGKVKWNAREDDADSIRKMMLSEALGQCLTVLGNGSGKGIGAAGLFLGKFIKDYWMKLGDRPTPLQKVIALRRIKHLCTGILPLLSSIPHHHRPTGQSSHSDLDPALLINQTIHVMEDIVIPELSIVGSHSNDGGNLGEGKIDVMRVVLELVCFGFPAANGNDEMSVMRMGMGSVNPVRWACGLVMKWFNDPGGLGGWKELFEEMFKDFVTNAEWHVVTNRLMAFVTRMNTPGEGVNVIKAVVASVFSHLTDRLIQDPPPPHLLASSVTTTTSPQTDNQHTRSQSNQSEAYTLSHSRSPSYAFPSSYTPATTLPAVLKLISDVVPQTFFKPLFSLAASSSSSSSRNSGIGVNTIALANTLCVVHALNAIVRDWWVRDSEMVCVALMMNVGEGGGSRDMKGKGKSRDHDISGSGAAGVSVGGRLGQMVALLELVGRLRALRRLNDHGNGSAGLVNALGSDAARVNLMKFVVGLELRLSILIDAEEKTQPLPPTQRLIFLMLFRETRLVTRSLKPAPWVPRILKWFEEYFQDEDAQSEEIVERLQEMREVYEFAKGAVGNTCKRRTVVMMPSTSSSDAKTSTPEESLNVQGMLDSSLKLLSSLTKGFVPRAVKLLVTVSAMLTQNDCGRVAPLMWYHGLLLDRYYDYDRGGEAGKVDGGGKKPKAVMPLICYLVMQCAEKNSMDFRAMVEVDMRSSDDLTRLESVHKLSLLVNWRFQLMSESHHILLDRTHRPFKLARAALPFMPADIGSPDYVHNEHDAVITSNSASHHSANSAGAGSHRSAVKARKGNMNKDAIPVELRKQLVEIGWVNDDVEGDEKEVWIRTPVSLLPVSQVEKLDLQRSENQQQTSPALSSSALSSGQLTALMATNASGSGGKVDGTGDGELLRRNSSSGGPTAAKRRAVFVPSLLPVFRVLAIMVFDPNFAVASAARDTILDLMRNDPMLLLRPILDLFCDEQGHDHKDHTVKDVPLAVNILTALIHTRHMIPPPMAHAIFNNLAGFLKFALREADPLTMASKRGRNVTESTGSLDGLTSFALTLPILSKLAMYVGGLTIREIRKSKMEHFFIPYGTLWFDHVGVPSGPMFPRGLDLDLDVDSRGGIREQRKMNPFQPEAARGSTAAIVGLDSKLVSVMMIRIAQNMMFVDMLKKSAQDVVLVRKTMPKFVVPRLDGSERDEDRRMLELRDFVPFCKNERAARDKGWSEEHAEKTLKVFSLALARSYVTLVAQVFRCMSRNSNNREEMASFVDGLNRILLVHGGDIGIVGHILIAFMVASARFRRLFTSGGGYALFMPVLAKVYAESHQRTDIKLAIEYAVYRFYALHREAFLFQSLDAIARVAALPGTDTAKYAARVYDLFYSLRNGVAPTSLDPAGIHGMNQLQEKEALLFHTAEDKPQTFLTAIRRGEGQNKGQIFFEVPDSYENSRLRMEDFIKLFLTIIAHDPSILRAQYFMRMFRFLVPHLYHASPQARQVLQDGLVALSEISFKMFAKSKATEANNAVRVGEVDISVGNAAAGQDATEKTKNTSNPSVMRLDFLFALISVGQAGCHIPTPIAKQAIEIAKLILKDPPREMLESLSTIIADLTKLILLRGEFSKPKYVIPFMQEISPFIRAYTTILDLTSVFETIIQVCSTPPYPNDSAFSKLVNEVCAAGLDACELITSEAESSNLDFRFALVSLLAEAVFLRGSDVIGELEKRKPSFHFLAKVILPLIFTLKTSNQLASDSGKSELWQRPALTSSWIRLLFYAMTACQRSFRAAENLPISRSKSREKKAEEKDWQTHLPTFTTSLQIIKAIVIRAEAEISSTLPDLWQRLAGFLKSALMDGNAHFALSNSRIKEFSPPPSPTPSPQRSVQVDKSGRSPSFFDLPGHSTTDSNSIVPSSQPRVIDYALWSILEFLCAYRSPLRLQLRLFTVEKVVALDQELKYRRQRPSPFTSPSTSPSRRISTSLFAKPRRSGMHSSPDSSPRASRSPSMLNELSIPSIHLGPGMSQASSLEIPTSTSGGELRIPGYQYRSPSLSPSTPPQGGVPYIRVDSQGPRIVHLGPVSPSALIPPPPLSPSGGGSMGVSNIRLMGQSTKIKSSALIKATYRRIRTVQTFMGYDALLPLPTANVGLGITGLGLESDEISIVTWTRRSALEAVLKEMEQLEEEFEELIKSAGVEDEKVLPSDSVSVLISHAS